MRRLLILSLLLAACSPEAEAEFSSIEVLYPDLDVPPYVAALHNSGPANVVFSFQLDSSKLGASAKPENQRRISKAELLEVTLSAKKGISDFTFLRRVHIVASLPASKVHPSAPTPTIQVADFELVGPAVKGSQFPLPLPEAVDITPLLKPNQSDQRKIIVTMNIGGDLPTTGWRTDVTMVMSANFMD